MKLMKKLSVFVFAMFMFVSMIGGASAYTGDYNLKSESDITFDFLKETNVNGSSNYLALKNNLKNNDAKVYVQDVQLTKQQFDTYRNLVDERKSYIKSNDPQTNEEKTAFQNKVNEYDAQIKNVIPDFDNTKWTELTLTETTDTENRYAVSPFANYAYYIVWAKVTIGGVDYYSYYENCLTTQPETTTPVCKIVDGKYYGSNGSEVTKEQYTEQCDKKVCRIENGKYYDKNGKEVTKDEYYKACPNPKTGNNTYYAYGIITVIGACILYMFTKRIKKFSK